MKAWSLGTTHETDPGPTGVGFTFDDGNGICRVVLGQHTRTQAQWHALRTCVEDFMIEYEGADELTVVVNDRQIARQAMTRFFKWKLDPLALEFFYLRKIARRLGYRITIEFGEVTFAEPIAQAAAELAADTIQEGPSGPEGESAG